jgi:LmbE family N-acetylglucosaminyl deacetylase
VNAASADALFVSPHLDDAVFSCGDRIAACAGAIVVTVFAGFAPRNDVPTRWDAECGFGPDDDVIAARRAEDRAALAALGATPLWLDFRDEQYGETRDTKAITRALGDLLRTLRPAAMCVPLGLFHGDHRRASDAALALVAPGTLWLAYADAIYRRIPGAVDERLAQLADRGYAFASEDASAAPASVRKREAVLCYRSQHRALRTRSAHDDVYAPERYWTVTNRDGAA